MKLECKKVIFFSENDENMFTEWLNQIKCVKKIEGIGHSLFIHIKSKKISDKSLIELIAIFFRYKIEMTQLSCFCNEKNQHWFKEKNTYWFKKVFKNEIN